MSEKFSGEVFDGSLVVGYPEDRERAASLLQKESDRTSTPGTDMGVDQESESETD